MPANTLAVMPTTASGGTAGHPSGYSGMVRASGSTDPTTATDTADTIPKATTANSARRQGSGRYRLRSTRRPDTTIPTANSATPTDSTGRPRRSGAPTSSTAYTPTPTPTIPTISATVDTTTAAPVA